MIIFGLDGVPEPKVVDYSRFKQLRFICLDYDSLDNLFERPRQRPPPSLNAIYFPFYFADHSQEDAILAEGLTSRHVPNLNTVGLPMGCWDQNNEEAESTRSKELWVERRKQLQELEMFTSGRVLLRLLKPREIRE